MAFWSRMAIAFEDRADVEVDCDQRDLAAWEMQPFWNDERVFVRMRYLAFSAYNRSTATKLSWPKFNEVCVSVTPLSSATDDDDSPTPVDQ